MNYEDGQFLLESSGLKRATSELNASSGNNRTARCVHLKIVVSEEIVNGSQECWIVIIGARGMRDRPMSSEM